MSRAPIEPSGPFLRHPLQPHELRDRVTRTEDAIVLWHLGLSQLDADSWSVAKHQRRIRLDERRRRAARGTGVATVQRDLAPRAPRRA